MPGNTDIRYVPTSGVFVRKKYVESAGYWPMQFNFLPRTREPGTPLLNKKSEKRYDRSLNSTSNLKSERKQVDKKNSAPNETASAPLSPISTVPVLTACGLSEVYW